MTYSIRLPVDIENRLETLSTRTNRPKSFYIRQAILEHIGDLEDMAITEQRLKDMRAGRTKPIPLEEVMKEHGMLEEQ